MEATETKQTQKKSSAEKRSTGKGWKANAMDLAALTAQAAIMAFIAGLANSAGSAAFTRYSSRGRQVAELNVVPIHKKAI